MIFKAAALDLAWGEGVGCPTVWPPGAWRISLGVAVSISGAQGQNNGHICFFVVDIGTPNSDLDNGKPADVSTLQTTTRHQHKLFWPVSGIFGLSQDQISCLLYQIPLIGW